MTGNVEPLKIINRLGHGVFCTKLAELDTVYAIQKISTNSSLMPEEIQPYQQPSMVYDNVDRLEETLCGAGTTQCKYNSYSKNFHWTQTPSKFDWHSQDKVFVGNVGIRPEAPVLPNTEVNLDLTTQEMSSKKNLIWFLSRYFNKEK